MIGSGEVAERSKALRQGRNLFGGVGSNPTLVTGFWLARVSGDDLTPSDAAILG